MFWILHIRVPEVKNYNFQSYRLINNLIEVRKRRQEMVSISKRRDSYNDRMEQQIRKTTERTTKILVVILAFFVLGEVPFGIGAFLTAWYGPKFFWKYFYYGIELCNSLTHVSETLNFVIYYSMCDQFRSTFKALFTDNLNNSMIKISQRSSSSLSSVNKPQDILAQSSSIVTISSSGTL